MGDFGNINVTKGKATVDVTDNVASIFGPPEMSVSREIWKTVYNKSLPFLSFYGKICTYYFWFRFKAIYLDCFSFLLS